MSPSLYLQHRRIFVFAVSRIADDTVYKPVASVVGRHKTAAKTRQPFPQTLSIISTFDKFPLSTYPCGLI